MNKNTFISLLAILTVVVALPVYAWLEPQRMEQAQTDLRDEFVTDAAVMYVENCAICHGATGEGIGATPALDSDGLREADYDVLYKVIARGRYDTVMAPWHIDEGGIYTDYQIDELIALIRYGDWTQVNELAATQGLIPPTLPVPEVDEAFLAEVAALGPEGSQWAEGMQLYANNCTVCHGVNGEGSDLGVALNTEDVRAIDQAELVRIITEGVPGTLMVGWNNALTPDEIINVVSFLQNWDVVSAEGLALTPPEPVRIDLENPEEVLAYGGQLFDTICAACHGENGSGGTGPALNSQQFLTSQTDEQILNTIINGGHRPNSTMPAFGDRLTMVEMEALVDYIRAWEPTAPVVENPRGTAQGGGPPWLRTDGTTTSGQGSQGQGQGQGQGGPPWSDTGTPPGQSGTTAPSTSSGSAIDMPNMGETLQFEGVVVTAVDNLLTFQTTDGQQLEAMLGPPWFWSESGIALSPGDQIELEGFESTDHMEVNWLQNVTTGERVNLRTPTGQPVWGGE
ncbi:MAG: c-type cytochrome [Ardenticatenaceae bacterium]|nr:c-type cytochrome [Ardenticatenaceae bacterium]MCB9003418.1 c-type cytochrome [Ardenticatenaceae bacterium]